MKDKSKVALLQEILKQQKALQNITNRINASANIKQVIVETRPMMIDLFKVEAAHVYVRDKDKKEIYTFVFPNDQTKEIRTVVGNQTIPGYVSNMAKMIKISDFSDSEQTGWFGRFATSAKRLTIRVRKSMIPLRKVSALRFLKSRTFLIPAISNCTAPGDATCATIRDTGDGSAFMSCSSIRRK